MNKVGICIWSFCDQTPAACKKAKEYGLEAIELELGTADDGYKLTNKQLQAEFLAEGAKYNIDFPTLGANELCNTGMAKDVAASKKVLEMVVDVAKDMNIPTIQLPSFVNGFIKDEQGYQNTLTCLKYVCELAKPYGINVGWENAEDTKTNLRMIDDVNSDNLYIYFDNSNPYHFSDMDGFAMIAPLHNKIVETHLKEQTTIDGEKYFATIGEGDSFTLECMDEFIKYNYNGYYILENGYDNHVSGEGFDALLKRDIAIVRKNMSK